jgi:cytochrome c556
VGLAYRHGGILKRIHVAIVVIAAAGLLAASNGFAQKKPYDQLMKEIGSTFASLRKNLDASAAATAVEDATKLEGLFRETEAFWTAFKTKDAIDAAKGAREAASAVAASAKAGSIPKAQTAYAGIGKYCTACHNAHREQMPDKTYRIKP